MALVARPRASLLFVTLALTAGASTACDRPPASSGLREWSPADHDQSEENLRQGLQAPRKDEPATGPDPRGLAEIAWREQCATCHGAEGRGDGPSGPMVQAPDLTKSDWVAKATDEDVATLLRNGKGKMPKFDLPEAAVKGLAARIRANHTR